MNGALRTALRTLFLLAIAIALVFFLDPYFEAISIKRECGVKKEPVDCVASALANLIRPDTSRAFKTLAILYEADPEIASHCNQITVRIADFLPAPDPVFMHVTPEAAFCNNGFFKEYARVTTIRGGLHEGQVFCSHVRESGAAQRSIVDCYRGIGFAAPFIDDIAPQAEVKSGIEKCEQLNAGHDETIGCIQGVFDHVSRAETEGSVSRPYRLFGPCDNVSKEYQAPCFGTYKGLPFALITGTTTSSILPLLEKRYGSDPHLALLRSQISRWLGYLHAQRSEPDPDYSALYLFCESIADAGSRASCINGVADGLTKNGKPGVSYLDLWAFCGYLADSGRSISGCADSSTLAFVKDMYSAEAFKKTCEVLQMTEMPLCR